MANRSLRVYLLTALLIGVLISSTACGGNKAQPGGNPPAKASENTLKIAFASDVLTFDPHNYKAGTDVIAQALIFDTLVKYDRDMKIVPNLASSWTQVNDKRWEFQLRQGVKFSDGTPVNANAVKVSLERCSKAPRGSGFAGFIESVDVLDEYRVAVNLKRPFGPILNRLCNPVTSIVSPAALEKYGDDIQRHPVGSGMYVLSEWVPGEKAVLKRNPDYWGNKPSVDTVIFRPIPEESTRLMALKTGEVDVIENPAPHEVANLKADKNFQVILSPRARNVWLGFNVKDKVLSNPKLREAICYAIDKKAIVRSVLEGMGRPAKDGFIPPEVLEVSDEKTSLEFPYDPARAQKLVAESGYSGEVINLWTPESRYLRDKEVCQVIQQQLDKVGIKVNITVMEWGSYLAALGRHEQQLYLIGWGFMTGEPSQALTQTLSTGNAFNYTNYSDPEFDRMLRQAEAEPDPAARAKTYRKMQEKLLFEDFAAVPLYYMYNCYAASSRVKGLFVNPIELVDVSGVTIEQ